MIYQPLSQLEAEIEQCRHRYKRANKRRGDMLAAIFSTDYKGNRHALDFSLKQYSIVAKAAKYYTHKRMVLEDELYQLNVKDS